MIHRNRKQRLLALFLGDQLRLAFAKASANAPPKPITNRRTPSGPSDQANTGVSKPVLPIEGWGRFPISAPECYHPPGTPMIWKPRNDITKVVGGVISGLAAHPYMASLQKAGQSSSDVETMYSDKVVQTRPVDCPPNSAKRIQCTCLWWLCNPQAIYSYSCSLLS